MTNSKPIQNPPPQTQQPQPLVEHSPPPVSKGTRDSIGSSTDRSVNTVLQTQEIPPNPRTGSK